MSRTTDGKIGRRSFLLGWFPFFHRRYVELSGIRFRVLRYGHSPRRFLFIHGNEDTARDVLTTHMTTFEGIAYLVTGSDREVGIRDVKIDPNRMFSRAGAEASIRALNPGINTDKIVPVLDYLDRERNKLIDHLVPKNGSRLVALHNNREYSMEDEIAGSDRTSLKQPGLSHDFLICTDSRDYEVLKQSPFNVILQSRPEPDDGSLSRLAARRGFRYINLECGIGEYEAQMERLRWLEDHVK